MFTLSKNSKNAELIKHIIKNFNCNDIIFSNDKIILKADKYNFIIKSNNEIEESISITNTDFISYILSKEDLSIDSQGVINGFKSINSLNNYNYINPRNENNIITFNTNEINTLIKNTWISNDSFWVDPPKAEALAITFSDGNVWFSDPGSTIFHFRKAFGIVNKINVEKFWGHSSTMILIPRKILKMFENYEKTELNFCDNNMFCFSLSCNDFYVELNEREAMKFLSKRIDIKNSLSFENDFKFSDDIKEFSKFQDSASQYNENCLLEIEKKDDKTILKIDGFTKVIDNINPEVTIDSSALRWIINNTKNPKFSYFEDVSGIDCIMIKDDEDYYIVANS